MTMLLPLLVGLAVFGGQTHAHGSRGVQQTVDAAAAGDTIRVPAGTYRGTLRIDRPLVLIAEGAAILDGGGRGTTVTIIADSVELRGFTVRGSGRSLEDDDAAVRVERCTGCVVAGNRIEDALHGVYLLESTRTAVLDNTIAGDSALAEARRGNGIHLFHSEAIRVERNVVRGTRDGIYFSFANGNVVAGNRVSGVRYGLHYMYSNDNRFTGNEFRRNAAGAALMFSHRIVLRDNVFAEHVGYRAYGILLQTSTGITAEGNRLTQNAVGLYLDNALDNRFAGNLIAGNGVGVDLLTSAEGNTFTGNAIVRNRVPVRVARGGSENAWAEHGRGNWWADPDVFDLDGDGIGDRPFEAADPFASLARDRPALDAFSGTLAARALAWAERALPVFDLPGVTDPAPLARAPAWLARLAVPASARPPGAPAAPAPHHHHSHGSAR